MIACFDIGGSAIRGAVARSPSGIRPVGSVARGAALLDNRTCVVMLRSARFAFANGAPRDAGPYYYRMSMVWKLP